ncbi:YdeI/OmpD-associated family protein [Roseovarius sp.]|uniref:YdeI/OmpD-associated family protein n=1 Tax=Roseovarius sp. TaxID=1486281 RepID=UPI003D12BE06
MVKRAADTAERIEVRSLDELHAWLAANHASAPSVWLVTFRKHTAFHLPYDDIVSELLCWGWIDSQPRKVDDDRTGLLIAPRNPRSAWSAANKARIDDLRAAGRLQPAGEALVAAAQNSGMWTFLDDVERLERPDDLTDALGDLVAVWDDWPRSVRRGTLEWIKTARTTQTRNKRIEDVVDSAAANRRPTPFRR